MLQTAVDEVSELLSLDRCYFFWYFHDRQQVQVVCESHAPSPSAAAAKVVRSKHQDSSLGYYPIAVFGRLASAIAQGEMVIDQRTQSGMAPWFNWFNQWASLPASPASESSCWDARATLMMPLQAPDGSPGFIACLVDRPRRWSAAEVELLSAIAQQLEIAIAQAQLYEQTQQQAQRERVINQIMAQTRQSFELETILREAIAQLLEALHLDRCLVHLVDDLNIGAVPPIPAPDLPVRQSASLEKHLYEVCRPPFIPSVAAFDPDGPMTRWVIQNRCRVVITDTAADDRIGLDNAEYQQAEIKSSLVVPVQTRETLYAILYLNQCSQVRYWSKNDQKLAQSVADQLAISVQQARLYAQTQQQAAASAAQAKHLAETLQELRLTQAQLIQSEKMSSLGRVVAGIAHEINNPINFIFGNLPYVETYTCDLIDLLKAYQVSYPDANPDLNKLTEDIELDFLLSDLPRILESMKVGADRIRQIVLSLRNFARLDEAHCKAVDIHEGIESTLLVLKSYLHQDTRILRNYGTLPLVDCYARQLNQVFMNILMNAIESLSRCETADKVIAIATDVIPATADRAEMVRIVVSDNGGGIPHEIQSKIFDPFFTTKDIGQGSGLGLTISYQTIVNQHQGQLKFYSEPGLGAEFLIELPVQYGKG